MLIKFDFSSKTGILVVKFAFATANLKIEILRMRRRFARVFPRSVKLNLSPMLNNIIYSLCATLVQQVLGFLSHRTVLRLKD